MTHVTKVAMVNACLFLVAAVALLVAPGALLERLSIPDPSFGVLALSRVLAAVLLVLGAVLWGARQWMASPQAISTLRLVSVAYAIAALLAFGQQLAIWDGGLGLSLCVVVMLFALEYGRLAWRASGASVARGT